MPALVPAGRAWLSGLAALKRRLALRTRFLRAVRDPRRFFRMNVVKTRCGVESLRNLVLDLRYGGSCGGHHESRFEETGAWGTSSVDYYQMPRLFNATNGSAITGRDVLVDVGCGKGRVINWWLGLGLGNKIVGLELDEQFAAQAAARLKKYSNVSIRAGNALENIPEDATLFFLFNPFKAPVVEAFKERLIVLFGEQAPIRIVYYMCLYVDVFEKDPRWVVERMRTKTFWPGAVIHLRGAGERRSHD